MIGIGMLSGARRNSELGTGSITIILVFAGTITCQDLAGVFAAENRVPSEFAFSAASLPRSTGLAFGAEAFAVVEVEPVTLTQPCVEEEVSNADADVAVRAMVKAKEILAACNMT